MWALLLNTLSVRATNGLPAPAPRDRSGASGNNELRIPNGPKEAGLEAPRQDANPHDRAITALGTSRCAWESAAEVVALTAIYVLLIYFFKPQWLLSAATATGGDTGAHVSWGAVLKESFLPRHRIAGWTSDWYAGFPLFTFYFPLPFLLIVLLSYAIPYNVAFKLVTVLGVFGLPVATYAALRAMGYERPMPVYGALMTTVFLFLENFTILGGNILSTLAGEFSYSISLAGLVLLWGCLERYSKRRPSAPALGGMGLLLAGVALSHVLTTLVAVIALPYQVLRRPLGTRIENISAVFLLGFGLSAFWSVPFVANLPFSCRMTWEQLVGWSRLYPGELLPYAGLALAGTAAVIARRDRSMGFFVWLALIAVALFLWLPAGRLWNGRILPFYYLSLLMLAGRGLFEAHRLIGRVVSRGRLRCDPKFVAALLVLLVTAGVMLQIGLSQRIVGGWIRWNYTGYEKKESYSGFRRIMRFMSRLPKGRVMWEHGGKIDKYGTPLAFMTLPYFAGQPTMESITLESAMSAPFHFINQAQVSKDPSYSVQDVDYPPFDMRRGVEHLKFYNVRYFIAQSPEAVAAADGIGDLRRLASIDGFTIYELAPTGYVTVLKQEPLIATTDDWLRLNMRWYLQPEWLDKPLVSSAVAAGDLPPWGRLRAGSMGAPVAAATGAEQSLRSSRMNPSADGGAPVRVTKFEGGEIEFQTRDVGKPHWIKMSFFPNWKAVGAKGPFLASPAFMIVVPTQRHVRMYYGFTWADRVGWYLTLASLGVLGSLVLPTIIRKCSAVAVAVSDRSRRI